MQLERSTNTCKVYENWGLRAPHEKSQSQERRRLLEYRGETSIDRTVCQLLAVQRVEKREELFCGISYNLYYYCMDGFHLVSSLSTFSSDQNITANWRQHCKIPDPNLPAIQTTQCQMQTIIHAQQLDNLLQLSPLPAIMQPTHQNRLSQSLTSRTVPAAPSLHHNKFASRSTLFPIFFVTSLTLIDPKETKADFKEG